MRIRFAFIQSTEQESGASNRLEQELALLDLTCKLGVVLSVACPRRMNEPVQETRWRLGQLLSVYFFPTGWNTEVGGDSRPHHPTS